MGRGASSIPIRQPTPNQILETAGQVKLISSLLNWNQIFLNGPQQLYAGVAGELLSTIRLSSLGFVAPSENNWSPADGVFPMIGTSIGLEWNGYAIGEENKGWLDTFGVNSFGTFTISPITTTGKGFILTPVPVIAAYVVFESSGKSRQLTNAGAWQPKTIYDKLAGGTISGEGIEKPWIIENGGLWVNNTGETGETGNVKPAFIIGETYEENGIIWNAALDLTENPSRGVVHAVSEIWTP